MGLRFLGRRFLDTQLADIFNKQENRGSPAWFLEGGNIKICSLTRIAKKAKNILSLDIFNFGHDFYLISST